ncbi:MAG: preprotein translocase subunit SecY [Candidatus Aenigmatarchaeota archaeon]
MNYRDLLSIVPGVEDPKKRLNFNDKLKWTGIIIIVYFIMGNITVWGVSPVGLERFQFLQTIVASEFGSLITLGIVPIVNASIILQLLTGSDILQWDTNTPEGKKLFMGTQKLLAVVFCLVQATAFVSFGAIPAQTGMTAFVIAQIAAGGILIVLMDEVISKWGFGSGVSLFIASGVSMEIVQRLFNPLTAQGTLPTAAEGAAGYIPQVFQTLAVGNLVETVAALIPMIFTVLVFFLVIYLNGMKVEIPLAFGQVKGFGQRYPLNLLYTSVIPIIFTHALLANLNIMGQMLAERGMPILGRFGEEGIPESGLLYWIYSPQAATPRDGLLTEIVVSRITDAPLPEVTIAWIPYVATVCLLTIVFSVFWMKTSGQDSQTVAERIHNMGMSVPGYRRDKRIIKRILDRYIPYLAVLSGLFIGMLAVFADFFGAVGGGIGILLATMIIYRLYEELAQQHMEDMHPALRQFIGE